MIQVLVNSADFGSAEFFFCVRAGKRQGLPCQRGQILDGLFYAELQKLSQPRDDLQKLPRGGKGGMG